MNLFNPLINGRDLAEKTKMGSVRFFRGIQTLLSVMTIGVAALSFAAPASRFDPANASPALLEMDQIVDQAPDLRTFAASPALRTELLKALQKYIGPDKVPPASFNRVLNQLVELDGKIPGFGSALWEKRAIHPPVTIRYQTGEGARYDLQTKAWDETLRSTLANLREKATPLLRIENVTDRAEEIARRVAAIKASVQAFQTKLNRPEEQSRIRAKYPDAAKAKTYVKDLRDRYHRMLTQSRSLQELVSYAVYQRLESSEETRDALRSGHAISILHELYEIQNGYPQVFGDPGFDQVAISGRNQKIPKILLDAARDLVPNAQRLASDPRLFTHVAGPAVQAQTFYEVHRPLYGAFRGLFTGECIGGNCSFLDDTTPTRTAVPVLRETEIRFAESSDTPDTPSLRGFTEIVPVIHRTSRAEYGSLLIGHPGFVQTITAADEDGLPVKTSLYELWLRQMKLAGYKLLMGKSDKGDNARVLHSIRNHPSYLLSIPAGPAEQFVHLDKNQPLVDRIVENSPKKEQFSYGSKGQMVFDAMLENARDLSELQSIDVKELRTTLEAYGPEGKLAFLHKTDDLDAGQKQKYFRDMRFMLKDPDLAVRRHAALWVATAGISDRDVETILPDWMRQSDFPVNALTRLASMKSIPHPLLAALGEQVLRIPTPKERTSVLVRNQFSPEKLDAILTSAIVDPPRDRSGDWVTEICIERHLDGCVRIAEKLLASDEYSRKLAGLRALHAFKPTESVSAADLRILVNEPPVIPADRSALPAERIDEGRKLALETLLKLPEMSTAEARHAVLHQALVAPHPDRPEFHAAAGAQYLRDGHLESDVANTVLSSLTYRAETKRSSVLLGALDHFVEKPGTDLRVATLLGANAPNPTTPELIFLISRFDKFSPEALAQLEHLIETNVPGLEPLIDILATRKVLTKVTMPAYLRKLAQNYRPQVSDSRVPVNNTPLLRAIEAWEGEQLPVETSWLSPLSAVVPNLQKNSGTAGSIAKLFVRAQAPTPEIRAQSLRLAAASFGSEPPQDAEFVRALLENANTLVAEGTPEGAKAAASFLDAFQETTAGRMVRAGYLATPEGAAAGRSLIALLGRSNVDPQTLVDATQAASGFNRDFPANQSALALGLAKLVNHPDIPVRKLAIYTLANLSPHAPADILAPLLATARATEAGNPVLMAIQLLNHYYGDRRELFEAALGQSGTAAQLDRKVRGAWLDTIANRAITLPFSETDYRRAHRAAELLAGPDTFRLDPVLKDLEGARLRYQESNPCLLSQLKNFVSN